jgi:hypothetical protein
VNPFKQALLDIWPARLDCPTNKHGAGEFLSLF